MPFSLFGGLAAFFQLAGLLGGLPSGLGRRLARLFRLARFLGGLLPGFFDPALLRGLATGGFLLLLATQFRLSPLFRRARLAFRPRQPGLPFRLLALPAALLFRQPFQFLPDRNLVHHFGGDGFDLGWFGVRRARDVQVEQ